MIYFVTAIGTGCGKTVVAAILTEALQADYWKPVQAGFPTDTDAVRSLVSNEKSRFFNEAYLLNSPESPHSAAKKDNKLIKLENISLPDFRKDIVIEGAGGILAPLNEKEFVIDIAQKFEAEIILVSNLYLGSINHTLLTVNELKKRKLNVRGIIFNGEANRESISFIVKYSGYRNLLHLESEEKINKSVIKKYAKKLALKINE